jgi:DUF1009 family protein
VVVKRCKPQQDTRFDLPSVGPGTARTMLEAGASCLIIEAERSLVFDRAEMAKLADAHNICIAAWSREDAPDSGGGRP